MDVSRRELRNSYAEMRDASKLLSGRQSYLLLFYSAECGLKAEYLDRTNRSGTDALPSNLRTHDLRNLAKELHMSGAAYQIPSCKRGGGRVSKQTVAQHELHQAWRYGAELDAADEVVSVAAIKEIIKWCQKELGR